MSFANIYRESAGDSGHRYTHEYDGIAAGPVAITYGHSDALYHAFMRFQLNIAKDSVITNAHIDMLSWSNYSGSIELRIKYNDIDDAVAPTTTGEFDALSWSSAYVTWIPEAWTASVWYKTPDLTSLVQAVVNKAGWVSGQYIMFGFDPSLISGHENLYRQAYLEYAVSGPFWPHLDVTWEAPGYTGKQNMMSVL